MSTGHVLLGLLTRGPLHGYELKRAYDNRLPQAKPLGFGQVYATPGRLERDGFVAADDRGQAGGPERAAVRLTASRQGGPHARPGPGQPPSPHGTSAAPTQ